MTSRILTVLTVALGLTFVPLAVSHAQDAPKFDLHPKWVAGQTAKYRINQVEVTTAAIEGIGEPQSSTIEVNVDITWEVTEVDEAGGGQARMTLDAITMKISGPTGEEILVDANSTDERTASMRDWINAMTGTPLDVTVSSDGKVTGVSNYQAIQGKAGPAGDRLDEDYFKEIAMDLAVLVGGQAQLENGAEWKHSHESDHRLGEITYDTTYSLQGVETIAGIDVALVKRVSDMRIEPNVPDVGDQAQVDVQINESSETSQIMFDLSRHEIVGANADQVIDMTITISAGGRQFVRTARESTNSQIIRVSEK